MSSVHFRNRVVTLAFVCVAFAAMAGVPVRAVGQEANPSAPVASQESRPQEALPAQPGQVSKEEAEDDNVYRHTKLVGSISDAVFHDDPNASDPQKKQLREQHIEKTARIFEWINAIILLLCIIIPLGRILPRVIRKRSQTLSTNLEVARKTTADANARLSAVEAQLSRLDDEIAKIRTQVEEESRHDEVRIKASIEEERARIVAAAEQEISVAAAQARRGLRTFAADLAIDQAARKLTLTPDQDRALIAEFVRESSNGSNGGHN